MAYSARRGRKYTIVGIDPGTTVGIAVIDLNGKPLDVFSSKNYSLSDVISRITPLGKPLIITSDVTPVPSLVKKVRSIYSSPKHTMDKSLSTVEKIALTKGEGYGYRNVHERDALAACIEAFKQYKRKFSQIKKKTPKGVDVDEVKALVVKGVSISTAIKKLTSEKEVKEEEKDEGKGYEGEEEEGEEIDGNILRLRGIIKEKDEQMEKVKGLISDLKERLEAKEVEIRDLCDKIEHVKSVRKKEIEEEKEVRIRDEEISGLREKVKEKGMENAELRKIIKELKGEGTRVNGGKKIKIIKSFSRNSILDTDRRYGLRKGDIVFLEDGSGGGANTAELLAKKGVEVVIYGKEPSHFAVDKFSEFGIPAFSLDEIPILEKGKGEFAFVDPRLLREKIEDWKREKKKKRWKRETVLFI